jgi:threonine dehydrogenase-like Zn-dependent dehydrogenase
MNCSPRVVTYACSTIFHRKSTDRTAPVPSTWIHKLSLLRATRAIQPGHTVAIVGVGFLGALLTALSVRARAKVIAITRRPFALEIARKLGAHATFSMDQPDGAIHQVKSLTSGAGCDCVIEAAGQQRTLDLAKELTRERGRRTSLKLSS